MGIIITCTYLNMSLFSTTNTRLFLFCVLLMIRRGPVVSYPAHACLPVRNSLVNKVIRRGPVVSCPAHTCLPVRNSLVNKVIRRGPRRDMAVVSLCRTHQRRHVMRHRWSLLQLSLWSQKPQDTLAVMR